MSKRHQASRRRAYGRRQHELHQRPDQLDATLPAALDLRAGAINDHFVVRPGADQRAAALVLGLAD